MAIWQIVGELIIGFTLLIFSAHYFIKSSANLAYYFKVPRLLVGVLLIGFGTSLPELIVSIFAGLAHSPNIAIGNVIGSNIANIALVAGFATLMMPLLFNTKILRREIPILLCVTIITGGLFYLNAQFGVISGVVLLLIFFVYLYFMYADSTASAEAGLDADVDEFTQDDRSLWSILIWWVVSLVLLLMSSEVIVDAATSIAHIFHISDLVIGLTIVAVGTSLPELAATVISTLNKEYDLAVGNVIGSSLFNLLLVLAMPALLSPAPVDPAILYRDFPVMALFIAIFCLLPYLPWSKNKLGRLPGMCLLIGYFGYLYCLVQAVLTVH